MKANWLLPRSPNWGRRDRKNCNISERSHRVDLDAEILDIMDASDGAASVYGGIPTATQPLPEVSDRASESAPPLPKKATERSHSDSKGVSPHWSPSVQNLLDRPPSAFPQQVMLGGVAFLAVLGAWAWWGTIDEIGRARGELVHQGNVYKIHSVESGKISDLAIQEGDTIKAGQILAELDTELDRTEIDRIKEQIAAYELQLVQMRGAIEQKQTESRTLDAIARSEIEAQNALIAQADENAHTVQSTIDLLHQDLAESETRRQRLTVEDQDPIAPELIEQLQAEIKANQTRLDRLQPLVERGAISQDFLFQAERDLRNSQNALLRTQMSDRDDRTIAAERLFDAEQSQRDRQSRLTEYQGQLEQARTERERLLAQLDRVRAEAEKSQLDLQEHIQQLEVELTQIQGKIADSRNLLAAAQTQLERRFLYAPTDGIVLAMHVDRPGEVIQPGQTLAEVAPSSAPLVLSAVLPEPEAGFIELGLPVQLKFDAYPYQEYGLISGKVTSISPKTQPNEKLGQVYQVEVTLDRNYVTEDRQAIYFKPGQTASAEIIIRQRRILDVILDPIRELKEGGASF